VGRYRRSSSTRAAGSDQVSASSHPGTGTESTIAGASNHALSIIQPSPIQERASGPATQPRRTLRAVRNAEAPPEAALRFK